MRAARQRRRWSPRRALLQVLGDIRAGIEDELLAYGGRPPEPGRLHRPGAIEADGAERP